MANQSILDVISSVDVVGVFDSETLQQVFGDARPMRLILKETSRVMQHPVEKGVLIADHRIIQPVAGELIMVVDQAQYSSAYFQLKSLFMAGTLLLLQTRTGVYSNLIIEDMPHEETPDMADKITLACRLREVMFVLDQPIYDPEAPADRNTSQNGQQQPTEKVYSADLTGNAARSFTSGAVTVTPPHTDAFTSGAVTVTP